MPRDRQEAKSEAAIAKVLEAALELFSSQGFRATTMREIADLSGLSVGNLYHHFPNKDALFERLIDDYWQRLLDPELPLNKLFARASFPDDLEAMAAAIEEVVAANERSILLIYVDVIEFRGQHIRAFYQSMADRFQKAYSGRFDQLRAAGEIGEADPMVAVMVASRWFFYYFTVERCFGVPMHLGMSPKQAVNEFIRLLRFGLLPRTGEKPSEKPGEQGEQGQPPSPGGITQ